MVHVWRIDWHPTDSVFIWFMASNWSQQSYTYWWGKACHFTNPIFPHLLLLLFHIVHSMFDCEYMARCCLYLERDGPRQGQGIQHCWLWDLGSEVPRILQVGLLHLSSSPGWGSSGRDIEDHWIMLHLCEEEKGDSLLRLMHCRRCVTKCDIVMTYIQS